MVQEGIPDPSEKAVVKALTKNELAKHCRRRTRGTQETIELIEELLLSLSPATDSLGMPLLKEEMKDIMGRAETAHQMSSRPSWYLAVCHHWASPERRCDSSCIPMC